MRPPGHVRPKPRKAGRDLSFPGQPSVPGEIHVSYLPRQGKNVLTRYGQLRPYRVENLPRCCRCVRQEPYCPRCCATLLCSREDRTGGERFRWFAHPKEGHTSPRPGNKWSSVKATRSRNGSPRTQDFLYRTYPEDVGSGSGASGNFRRYGRR